VLRLWRLYPGRYGPGLDGIGGTFADGRWHRRGDRVVYFGLTAAITVLERLAHTDPDLLPSDLVLGSFLFDSDLGVEVAEVPDGWTRDEWITQRIGSDWVRSAKTCLLRVPSVIVPEESNAMLNASHADARALKLVSERPFSFDPRLL
jgi:RES domain-containing protein